MKTKFRILLSAITFIAGVALLFAALALPGRLAAQAKQNARLPHYTVTDLGTLGGTFSYAIGLNNRGWAGGAATLSGDTAQRAVLWANGKKIDLGTLGGPNSALFGPGMNEKGQVVANADTDMEDPLGQDFCGYGTQLICLPFVWQKGVMTALPTLGGYNANAYAINDRGQIAGQAQNTTLDQTCSYASQETPPVIWENGQVRQLPMFQGDTFGTADAINEHGQAVGSTGDCTNNFRRAVLWQNGTVTDLGNLGGIVDNAAYGINNKAQIVGQSSLPGQPEILHAFLWQNGVMTDLGTLYSDDVASSASHINDKGQVVGGSCNTNICRAFLWQNGVMTDLNTLTPPDSQLQLGTGFNINARGQIVGIATQLNTGELHAFLATPCGEGDESCEEGGSKNAVPQTNPAPRDASNGTLPQSLLRRISPYHFGGRAFGPKN